MNKFISAHIFIFDALFENFKLFFSSANKKKKANIFQKYLHT